MYFSHLRMAFYPDLTEYTDLPDDLIEITQEQHQDMVAKLNQGYTLLKDLSYLPPKPTQYHTVWFNGAWRDSRTAAEQLQAKRVAMPDLSTKEFRKLLRDNNLFDAAELYVKSSGNGYLEDAWNYSDYYSRLDPFTIEASEALGLTPEQVDTLWVQA